MSDSVSVISLDKVSLRRSSKHLLRDVSWEIRQGEHWALFGANGSGKTMLLKIALGQLWPSDGEASIFGRPFGSFDKRTLSGQVAYVHFDLQYQFLQREDSVDEVIVSGAYGSIGLYDQTPTRDIIERAKEVSKKTQCNHLAGRSFDTLSFGEQKRVLIARSLMTKPTVLILDEPCIGLDISSRERFLKDTSDLAEAGLTIIFVTHHVEEVMPFITHCHFIKEGKTVASGLKTDVLNSEVLSEVFSLPLSVRPEHGRYHLSFDPRERNTPS